MPVLTTTATADSCACQLLMEGALVLAQIMWRKKSVTELASCYKSQGIAGM